MPTNLKHDMKHDTLIHLLSTNHNNERNTSSHTSMMTAYEELGKLLDARLEDHMQAQARSYPDMT